MKTAVFVDDALKNNRLSIKRCLFVDRRYLYVNSLVLVYKYIPAEDVLDFAALDALDIVVELE